MLCLKHISFKIIFTGLLLVQFTCNSKQNEIKKHKQYENLEPIRIVKTRRKDRIEKLWNFIEEKEPNDHPVWAQFLPPKIGVKGHINRPWKQNGIHPDRDVFLFDVPAPGEKILWAKVTGVPNINLFLSVYKKSGDRILIQDVNGVGKEEIIVNLTLKPGKYFFKIGEHWKKSDYKFDTRHFYKLLWRLTIPYSGEEIEPNDRRTSANKLKIAEKTRGYLSSNKDNDNYILPKQSTQLYRLDYFPPKGVNSVLWFWKDKAKSPSLIYPVKNNHFVLRKMKMSEYKYLTIHPKNTYSLTSKYILKISYETDFTNYETEVNDQKFFANKIPATGIIKGFISHPKDVDFLKINLKADTNTDILIQSDSKIRFCIIAKKTLCKKTINNKITFYRQYLSAGINYFSIKGIDNSYEFEHPYKLSIRYKTAFEGDEREPNNNFYKANRIAPNVPVRGLIYPQKDQDVYSFHLRGTIKSPPFIKIKLTGGENINPVIILKDSWNNIVMEDIKGVYSGIRKIETSVHPNVKYYIIVKDKDNTKTNTTNPYELKLEILKNINK